VEPHDAHPRETGMDDDAPADDLLIILKVDADAIRQRSAPWEPRSG
jgi:hypothetical protein